MFSNTNKITFALLLATAANASPFLTPSKRQAIPPAPYFEMTFVAGPASYNLVFQADGSTHEVPTADAFLSISQIFATAGLDIHKDCSFEFGKAEGVQVVITPNAQGGVDVGPPGPVKSVTCNVANNSEGTCLVENAGCTTSSSSTGFQYTGTCCSGLICAANKCRSTTPVPPPQPTCGTLYADCGFSPINGAYIASCCEDFYCAATKCRAMSTA